MPSNPATANDARRPGTTSLPTTVSASVALSPNGNDEPNPHAT